jgi:hypothetical protein
MKQRLANRAAAVGFPLARRYAPEHATFTTLLMSTGLPLQDDLFALMDQRWAHR